MKTSLRLLLLLLTVFWAGLAGLTYTRIEWVGDPPLTNGADLSGRADQNATVRVTGTLEPEEPMASPLPILLERIQVDSGKTPAPHLAARVRALLQRQKLPTPMEFDMVSPPRVALQVDSTRVLLQTEDINLDCWPPAFSDTVTSAYPPDAQGLLIPTMPTLPVLDGPTQVRIYTLKPGESVTVIGAVSRDGTDVVIGPPDHYAPFVISPLPYDTILSKLHQRQHLWETLAAFSALCSLGCFVLMFRRRRV